MLIKTNKKKNIFSKYRDIQKFALDLEAEYLATVTAKDENLKNKELIEKHIILLKVPIDKVSAIKNQSSALEGYVCRDISHLRTRNNLLSGFNKSSARDVNFAIANKEQLARDSFKSKMEKAYQTQVFGVDIASRLFPGIKIIDVI